MYFRKIQGLIELQLTTGDKAGEFIRERNPSRAISQTHIPRALVLTNRKLKPLKQAKKDTKDEDEDDKVR